MAWVTSEHPTREELDACVQCGLCLPVCPTFRLTGRETASPRGRLHAMSAVAEGAVEVDEVFAQVIDFCLGCRACEPVCPGLVPYGRAFEGAKAEITEQLLGRKRKRRWQTTTVLGSRATLRLGSIGMKAAQSFGLLGLAPAKYQRVTSGLRPMTGRGRPTLGHSGGSGEAGTVAFLAGCVQDEWFRPVNRAAVTLLERAGHRVEAPRSQTCCGALAAHDGQAEAAHRFEERNTQSFADFDLVVATAAGCSAHLAGYEDLRGRVGDITVAVARAIQEDRLPVSNVDRGEIAIQDPCHLRHAQRVFDEPRQILEAAGYRVVEVDPVGLCCGAAGVYTIAQPETSATLGNQKADQVRSTGVTKVASANPGCEMQLRSHLGDDHVVAHPIEWYLAAIEDDIGADD